MKTLNITLLNISDFQSSIEENTVNIQNLADAVFTELRTYPYFVVVDGYPIVGDRSNLITLAKAIQNLNGNFSEGKAVVQKQNKISFTKVRIDRSRDALLNREWI